MQTRPIMTLGCAAALLAATTLPVEARAQDAEPGGPVLRVKFTDGKPVHLREKRRVEEIIDSGMIPMVRETVLVRDMTLTSQGKTDGGDWKVEWKFDRVLGSIKSPLATEAFDTKQKRTGETNLLIEPLVAIAGTSFTVTISERGEVKSVDGAAEALKQATEQYGDEADMYRMVLREAFSADSVRRELQFVLQAAPLPEGAVTADGTWTVEGAVAGPTGVTWTFTEQVRSDGGYNDIAEFEATGEGGATVNKRRTTAIGMLLNDEIPDAYFVSASYAIAKSDGLPLGNFMSFWADATAEDEDGAESTYRFRAKYTVERTFDEELPGVRNSTRIPKIDLISSWHPQCYTERLSWARAKGRLYAGSEEPDEARETFTAARALTEKLIAGKTFDEIAATDGTERDWLEWWTIFTNDLASMEFDADNFDAAIAAWDSVTTNEKVVAAAKSGDGRFIWEGVRADVMVAQSLAMKGDTPDAMKRFEKAEAGAIAGQNAAPDDAGLRRAHAWLLDRWCVALSEAGSPAEALAKGEEALAIRDADAAADGREAGAIRDLVDRLWELSDLALAAGDAKQAAVLLDRAQNEVQALFAYHDSFQSYHTDLVQRRDDCIVIDTKGEAEDAAQSARLAYMLVAMKRHVEAHTQYELAFVDESIRDNWDDHNLYNAACNAALAHAIASDEDKPRYEKAALGWLKPHVDRLLEFAADDDEEMRAGAVSYLDWIREGDSDLESLRTRPGFKALFE